MPLAACKVSLQFRFSWSKLSWPFGLSLQRLFESFVMFVQVSIFCFTLLRFIDMSACCFYRSLLTLYFVFYLYVFCFLTVSK